MDAPTQDDSDIDGTGAVVSQDGASPTDGTHVTPSQDVTAGTDNADLVDAADQLVGTGGAFASSPALLLNRALSGFIAPALFDPLSTAGLLDPARLFDSFAIASPGLRHQLSGVFDVVGWPRQRLRQEILPGDVLLRRALAEPGLAHAAFIAVPTAFQRDEATRLGLRLESVRPGVYAMVVEAGSHPHRLAHRFARRIADAEGIVPADTLILRLNDQGMRSRPSRSSPLLSPAMAGEQAGHPAAAPPPAPPTNVASMILGVDFYEDNPLTDADFANLRRLNKVFALIKCSQGLRRDNAFSTYYANARKHGFIRGSYHFFANKTGTGLPAFKGTIADQAALVIDQVPTLLPGDLAPALDLEDEARPTRFPLDQGFAGETGYQYRHIKAYHDRGAAGQTALLTDIQDFLDRVEAGVGRTPLIYTSIMWRDTDMMNNPADLDPDHPMKNYPLWTVRHSERDVNTIAIGGWGTDWKIVQYAEQGKKTWGMTSYAEPGITIPGLDYDAAKISMYELRGLADIGRVGVTIAGASAFVAATETDDHLHLLSGTSVGGALGADRDLTALLGRNAGDPVLLSSSTNLLAYFRGGDHLVEASAPLTDPTRWQIQDIEDIDGGDAVVPVQDPRAVLWGDRCYLVYVGSDADWHVLIAAPGGWKRVGGALAAAGLRPGPHHGRASGQPSIYVTRGTPHVIGRVGTEGHLFDLAFDGARWTYDDLTQLGRDTSPNMPAATYSPCAWETNAGVSVAFRAVRGDLWVIERTGNTAINLMTATQADGRAVAAAGHPTCLVFQDKPHIVYRAADGSISDLWLDAGHWHWQRICSDAAHRAAADPVAAVAENSALVTFRSVTGQIQIARFDGTAWNCGI